MPDNCVDGEYESQGQQPRIPTLRTLHLKTGHHTGEPDHRYANDGTVLRNGAPNFSHNQTARFGSLPSARCVVCDVALPRSFANGVQRLDPYPSCHGVACRMIVSRREEMGEAGFRHYLQMQARHKQHLAAAAKSSMARQYAEIEENAAGWSELRLTLPAALTCEPLHLLLPSGPRRASRLKAGRRERYRAHLLWIITEAQCLDPAISPPANVAVISTGRSTMPGHLCALCGGGCCTRGGDEAYLNAATLRRFMNAQPQLSTAEVAAAYLNRMSVKNQTDSCVNHTGQGCSLPPEMRSDICNRFSCQSLARLQAAQRDPDAAHVVLIVRRKQDHWHRAEPGLDNAVTDHAVLRETGVQRVAGSALPEMKFD